MENVWPYFSVRRQKGVDGKAVYWCGTKVCDLKPWRRLEEVFEGRDVFILATGPSIGELDLDSLHSYGPVIGVNGAIAAQSTASLKFAAYFIVDRGFIERRFEMFEQVVRQKIPCFLTFQCLFEVCKKNPGLLKETDIFLIENINERFGVAKQDFAELSHSLSRKGVLESSRTSSRHVSFSHDPELGVYDGATVVHWALQVLVKCQVAEIAILGMDMGVSSNKVRFYEAQNTGENSSLADNFDDVILPSLRLVSQICRRLAIGVVNLAPQSRVPSEVFAKGTLHEYLSGKNESRF